MNDPVDTLMVEQAFISFGGREVLHSAGIRVIKGKITGLLGSNGTGKSTLLQIMFGSLRATDAIVSHHNRRLPRQACSIPELVNYLPQFAILPLGIKMARLCRLFDVAPEVLFGYFPDLREDMNSTADELSGGKLRLWQALLLILAPTAFTLLDEPFTHLAPIHIDRLKQVLRDLTARKGFLLTDHMYVPLLEIADEMWFMKSGQTFLLRTPEDLVLHGYVRTMHMA